VGETHNLSSIAKTRRKKGRKNHSETQRGRSRRRKKKQRKSIMCTLNFNSCEDLRLEGKRRKRRGGPFRRGGRRLPSFELPQRNLSKKEGKREGATSEVSGREKKSHSSPRSSASLWCLFAGAKKKRDANWFLGGVLHPSFLLWRPRKKKEEKEAGWAGGGGAKQERWISHPTTRQGERKKGKGGGKCLS